MRISFTRACIAVLTIAFANVASAQTVPGTESQRCSDECTDQACTPPDTIVYGPVLDVTEWQSCDICCVDPSVMGDSASVDSGMCTAATKVAVNSVQDCIDAVNAAAAAKGGPVKVCFDSHGSPGSISMGAGTGAGNGESGADSDVLDDASKGSFAFGTLGDIDTIHIFACSVAGDGGTFIEWLATETGASHVSAPDKVICTGDLVGGGRGWENESGGMIVWKTPDPTANVHFVHDHVWSNFPVNWSPGSWTRDGLEICQTFPGGVATGGAEKNHKWDWRGCPDWPNDWHWSVIFPWASNTVTATIWFNWLDLANTPGMDVEIYCLEDPGVPINDYDLMIDVDLDVYQITSPTSQFPPIFGTWSLYPGDLPPNWQPTGIMRTNSAPLVPGLAFWGIGILVIGMLGGGLARIRRST